MDQTLLKNSPLKMILLTVLWYNLYSCYYNNKYLNVNKMKNYKYLFLFFFCLTLIISSPKFSEARLAFHGGYVFETLKGAKSSGCVCFDI